MKEFIIQEAFSALNRNMAIFLAGAYCKHLFNDDFEAGKFEVIECAETKTTLHKPVNL